MPCARVTILRMNTTVRAARPALLVLLWHELRVGLPLCFGIATLLSLALHDSFASNLAYSLCIGLTIQALIELGRYAMASWLQRRRPQAVGPRADWPGWALMLPWVAVATPVGYWAGSMLADLLTGHTHAHRLFSSNLRVLSVALLLSMAVSMGATFYFYARGRMAAAEAQAEAARRAAVENQLLLLQSQLEPHMLFNTLANLRVLIGLDAARAQAMLDRLIAFLRASLNATRAGSHALGAEFDRVADYLALMQVRMGARLSVDMVLPDELRDLRVPPLLLQPLVENSIQHGLEPKVEGGLIEVRARREGGQLSLTVRDSGVGLGRAPQSAGTGFGLAQVRERLAALFGAQARLSIEALADADGGGTLARIEMPVSEPTSAHGST